MEPPAVGVDGGEAATAEPAGDGAASGEEDGPGVPWAAGGVAAPARPRSNRKACHSPLWRPTPAICGASLMAATSQSCQPLSAGRKALRSVAVPPIQMTARFA